MPTPAWGGVLALCRFEDYPVGVVPMGKSCLWETFSKIVACATFTGITANTRARLLVRILQAKSLMEERPELESDLWLDPPGHSCDVQGGVWAGRGGLPTK